MVTKIISGGQTGADQGGLVAARTLGISTGGTAPKNYMTEDGPEPVLASYGLVEADLPTYQTRTRQNVEDSDGTAIFSTNLDSGGTRLTIKYCEQASRPYIINPNWQQLRDWAAEHDIQVLNVVGNRASKDPTAYQTAFDAVLHAFS